VNYYFQIKIKKEASADEVVSSKIDITNKNTCNNTINDNDFFIIEKIYTRELKPDFKLILKNIEDELGYRPKLTASGIKKIKDSLDEVFSKKKNK